MSDFLLVFQTKRVSTANISGEVELVWIPLTLDCRQQKNRRVCMTSQRGKVQAVHFDWCGSVQSLAGACN